MDSKDPDIHALDGWMLLTTTTTTTNPHTQRAYPRRRNVTTSMVGLRNSHIKISPQMVSPRDITGYAEEEKEEEEESINHKITYGPLPWPFIMHNEFSISFNDKTVWSSKLNLCTPNWDICKKMSAKAFASHTTVTLNEGQVHLNGYQTVKF